MMIQSIQFMSCQTPLNLFHARSDRRFNYVIQFMCKVWTHFLPTFCQCTCVAWQLSPRKSIGRNSRCHSCQCTGRRQSDCGLGDNKVGAKITCHSSHGLNQRPEYPDCGPSRLERGLYLRRLPKVGCAFPSLALSMGRRSQFPPEILDQRTGEGGARGKSSRAPPRRLSNFPTE